jgi:diacylglycerol kinase (ATP)
MTSSPATRPPLVIVNARASRLHDPARRARIREELGGLLRRRFGFEPDWVDGSHAEALAALRDPAGRPLIIAVGGDGTVREAAAAVAGTHVPLAVVPGGTGNVLAGALRIGGVERALRAIRDGHDRRLDMGMARFGTLEGDEHERPFLVACGTGFDARVMAAAEHQWKRHLRFGAYVGAAVRELARMTPARFRIVADGDVIELVGLVVLIANAGEIVPGRIGPRQPIDPADGRLDLIVIGGRDVLAGLRGAADVLFRTGDLDGAVVRRSVSAVRVDSDPAQPVQTDGDAHEPGWLEATVLPGALTVLVPDPPASRGAAGRSPGGPDVL